MTINEEAVDIFAKKLKVAKNQMIGHVVKAVHMRAEICMQRNGGHVQDQEGILGTGEKGKGSFLYFVCP